VRGRRTALKTADGTLGAMEKALGRLAVHNHGNTAVLHMHADVCFALQQPKKCAR
jgi:hypothetical protein